MNINTRIVRCIGIQGGICFLLINTLWYAIVKILRVDIQFNPKEFPSSTVLTTVLDVFMMMKIRKLSKIFALLLLILCTSSCIYCFGNGVPYQSCGEAICAEPDQVKIAEILSEARVEAGFDCLRIDQYLTDTAQNHADYLTLNGGMLTRDESEGNPGFTGETWNERIRGSGYSGNPASEFLAMGYAADQVAEKWLDSSEHKQYFMIPEITDLGIGFSENIWVVDLGIR